MTTNHPAHGPVSLDRLHQISEILSKAAAQSDGGNLGYAMADAVKVIDGAIAAFSTEPDGNDLLPCPFCGGGAEFDYDDDNLNWISCNVCGISTDTVYHTDVDARDKLRAVWNRRAAMLQSNYRDLSQPVDPQVAEYEEMMNQAGSSPVASDCWIPVSDRMPEDTQMVLTYSHGEIVAAYWNYVMCPIEYKKYRAFTYLSGNLLDGVTHWMPLPAEPKQEVKNG